MASWSPSQSDPLTVSYMCHCQLSSPMLPSAAEMPPCAATVWERVGKTLVTQAVFRPFCARPKVARRPAPPAPTTTTSYLCSMILYAEVIGSARQRDACDREQRCESADGAEEVHKQLERDPGATSVHVVLDDHLETELGMPEQRDRERGQQDRVARPGDRRPHRLQVGAGQRHQGADEPCHQEHQRHRGRALQPEVAGAGLGRTEPARALERRAEIRDGGLAAAAHAPPRSARNQTRAVRTGASTATVQPLRYTCWIS